MIVNAAASVWSLHQARKLNVAVWYVGATMAKVVRSHAIRVIALTIKLTEMWLALLSFGVPVRIKTETQKRPIPSAVNVSPSQLAQSLKKLFQAVLPNSEVPSQKEER